MKYKLSKSGVERIQRFKRDVENGDCEVTPKHVKGEFLYCRVENNDSTVCIFDDLDNYKDGAFNSIDQTLTGEVKVGEHADGTKFYYISGGCGLTGSDVEMVNA